jgi:hypothetical protein
MMMRYGPRGMVVFELCRAKSRISGSRAIPVMTAFSARSEVQSLGSQNEDPGVEIKK